MLEWNHAPGSWLKLARLATFAIGAASLFGAAAAQGNAPAVANGVESVSVSAGRDIYLKGTSSGAIACTTCHGPDGWGSGEFPRLAGAGHRYLAQQLEAGRLLGSTPADDSSATRNEQR